MKRYCGRKQNVSGVKADQSHLVRCDQRVKAAELAQFKANLKHALRRRELQDANPKYEEI